MRKRMMKKVRCEKDTKIMTDRISIKAESKNNDGKASQQGITLVALVITIIIIIILATVTINMAFGDNGLIKQAELARDMAANSTQYETESMANLTAYMNEIMGGNPPGPTLPDGWDGSKVTPEESDDGVIVPVPIGYVASDATGEHSVNDGFVIYEGNDEVNDGNVADAKTSRNQFVWIPVDDINQIAKTVQNGGTDGNGRTNYQGKLYNFSSTRATEMTNYGQGTTSYREPDVVTAYDGTSYDNDQQYVNEILGLANSDAFKTQLQEEFNEMIESVDTYGGFYIGRYETGNLESNTTTEPVVVKGNDSNSNVNWYYMYENSKKIATNSNVVSTMIWGSLWDRTLIWLTETGEKTYAEIRNSRTWGNYNDSTGEATTNSGSKRATGFNEAWKANNIYDLAGNVNERTIEAYDTSLRLDRGGGYGGSGSVSPASVRYGNLPSDTNSYTGTRPALYVK